jgi:hypothetical protein
MKRWLSLAPIKTSARREPCKRLRIYVRTGSLRGPDGFEEKHIIMDKELS